MVRLRAKYRSPRRHNSNENLCEQAPKLKKSKKNEKGGNFLEMTAMRFFIVIFGMTVASVVCYMAHKGYVETRLNTPYYPTRVVDDQGLEAMTRFWGSYRSGVYFGMKTRGTPGDLLTGLMWMIPSMIKQGDVGLRHWCEQGDNLERYGWIRHDGANFGEQEIFDRGLNISTSFVKDRGQVPQAWMKGGSWTARVRAEHSGNKKKPEAVTFFYYAGLDAGAEGELSINRHQADSIHPASITGKTSHLGRFRMSFKIPDDQSKSNILQVFHSNQEMPKPEHYTNIVMNSLRLYQEKGKGNVIGLDPGQTGGKSGFAIIQINAKLPFEFDIVFQNSEDFDHPEISGEKYTESLMKHRERFNKTFEATFPLEQKGFDPKYVDFAKAALSNMLGGIGYFYGHSLVKSEYTKEPVEYWNAPLYTGVPSRSFFPRGFLWDEGFHNLLISKWNPVISADIMAHWFDLMNWEGWIPREQILGNEARAKVPAEFVVQSNQNANPPTLILTLHSMVKDFEARSERPQWFDNYLKRLWTRLEAWYLWFDTTQSGPLPGTYRWRGRNRNAINELNPKTLTSGLDDFPRASHPTGDERHVDLRCWMALASRLMADIAKILGKNEEAVKYSENADFLYNNELLDSMHWSQEHGAYLDFGLHSEGVLLQRPKSNPNEPKRDKVRVTIKEPKMQFVNQIGYISLFPLLLGIIDDNSPKLPKILEAMEDPKRLYTPYGLRSLSKEASLYNKHNTEHDPPYWRGPIWMNINYLAVRALHNLKNNSSNEKIKEDAARIYDKLRKGLIDNLVKEYYRTGYIWEQYDDKTGKGKGCRPFTGWSALVVLLMSENY